MPSILFVGRNLHHEYSPGVRVMQDVLAERGLRRKDVEIVPPWDAQAAIRRLCPNVVVALGDDACATLIPGWDQRGLNTLQARGYLFETAGPKVLASVHPDLVQTAWVPWRMLLSHDVQRARDEAHTPALVRPTRDVHVVRDAEDARRCAAKLMCARRVACDIEIYDSENLACVGFASSNRHAIVFPARYAGSAFDVLRHPVRKVFQNGQFDLYFLLTRCGVRVNGYADDTIVAWHACYPELAGMSTDSEGARRGNKMTRKSLSFLASMFTNDAWWKDYEFENDGEMYELNGRDCCITFQVMEALDTLLSEQGVERIYVHGISMIWPCVDMQAEGLYIDEDLRAQREAALAERVANADARLNDLLLPLIEERIDVLDERVANLFRKRRRCDCCLNSNRRSACWSCHGFSKEPKKPELLALLERLETPHDPSLKKAELLSLLNPCKTCGGAGEWRWLEFNSRSVDQKRALLYDILKLPKRYNDGGLSTDEDALKGLLANVS